MNIAAAYKKVYGTVFCLRVNDSVKNGLIIREEPTTKSRLLGIIKGGEIAQGTWLPLIIPTEGNRHWIQIDFPLRGWITTGKKGINENVSLCTI